jgi:hypothetical protein
MAMPTVSAHGLLNPGVHPMTLDEIDQLFGRFQRSDKRMKLVVRLRLFVKAVRDVDPLIKIFINGSFIMTKVDEPGDIDVVLLLPPGWNFAAELRPFEYNILSRRMVRKLHRFDMFVGVDGEESARNALDFFAQVNVKWLTALAIPEGTIKGIVRIEP